MSSAHFLSKISSVIIQILENITFAIYVPFTIQTICYKRFMLTYLILLIIFCLEQYFSHEGIFEKHRF